MRATLLQRIPLRAVLFLGALGVTGIAACADALHLDPPGADAGTGTSTSSTSGAGAQCHSNPDCAFPTPVCDTVSLKCVGCLVLSDCADEPGTVCSKGSCECPSPDAAEKLAYCAGESPTCVDTNTSPTNCGGCGKTCVAPEVCTKGKCLGTGGMGGASGTGGTGGVAPMGTGGSDGGL
jgi:hypothetical protein